MVCDKVVCERWSVKDGVWQSCVWKMVWWQSGVWKMVWWKMVCDKVVCDKVVCERWCVTKWCVKEGVSKMVPRLPRKTKVDVRLCHPCHVKRTWMSPSATPATQTAAASPATKTGPSTVVSAMSATPATNKPRWMWDCATPATQNQGGCEIAPHLPRETNGGCDQVPRLPRKVPRCHPRLRQAQARHPVPWVPRLPRKTKVNVRLCHACHVKRTVDVTKCHACHAKCRGHPQLKRAQARHPVPWVPRLPRKTKVNVRLCHACHVKRTVDVTKCHACHAKCRGHPQLERAQARHPVPWVPRLPRKTKVKRLCHACHVKRPVDVTKCHACHAKCRGVIRD